MKALARRLSGFRSEFHLPRRTVRLRLTMVYGSLFLLAGLVLLGITFALVHHSTGNIGLVTRNGGFQVTVNAPRTVPPYFPPTPPRNIRQTEVVPYPGPGPAGIRELVQALLDQQRGIVLHQLVIESGIALAVVTVLSIGLGWLMAGRVLRPLRTITGTVRNISAENLQERLALGGPDDEIKELGNTFDGLLARLDASFEAQRQFVANASHELRTPLSRQRTLVEVALRDSQPTIESLQATNQRVLAAGEQQERLIEALLTLARGERGLDRRDSFDLAAVTGEVLATRRSEAERQGLVVESTLEPALTSGDPGLVELLVANLVDNALQHNIADGKVLVATGSRDGKAVLSITNSGPVIPPDEVERLFEPFRRLGEDRTSHGEGFGLGLSIVRAIAAAHDAPLSAHARPDGGLEVEVAFPLAGSGETA